MKINYLLLLPFLYLAAGINAQGYDIKINFKGCPDNTVYLARYFWDQLPISDSCKNVQNGKISFKGSQPLEKGVYFLANEARNSFYCQFIVDGNQKFTINLDNADVATSLKSPDDKQNDQFFSYIRFMTLKNKELVAYREQQKGKPDSAKLVTQKQLDLNKQSTAFDKDFMARNKGTFVHELMNLKSEKYPTDVPLASNGRPDSIYQYFYYKNHYFDGINFKDDRMINTPFFADKVKKYFEHMVSQHPDSVIKDIDKILMQCVPGSIMFNTLVGHFTKEAEQNKTMSFDNYGRSNTFEKVFIHLADKYIISGKTEGYYSAETIAKLRERVDILRNLLPGARVANLYMIDTIHGRKVLKMGFDTAQTSESVTKLYNQNADKLAAMYRTLYDVKAKYTLLVFWAADCSHCTTELPKLNKELERIKGKIDYKVYAVQTKEDLFETWKKFIAEKKLNDFTHVFDPVHLNNLKEQFDIVATPVIYLLDKDKRIIGKKLASDQVVEIMEKLEEISKEQTK